MFLLLKNLNIDRQPNHEQDCPNGRVHNVENADAADGENGDDHDDQAEHQQPHGGNEHEAHTTGF